MAVCAARSRSSVRPAPALAGKTLQPQNLPRGVLKEAEIEPARVLAAAGDISSIPDALGRGLAGAGVADPQRDSRTPGRKQACADLASIETVMLGWASGCRGILRVFEQGSTRTRTSDRKYLFRIHYDEITKQPSATSASRRCWAAAMA